MEQIAKFPRLIVVGEVSEAAVKARLTHKFPDGAPFNSVYVRSFLDAKSPKGYRTQFKTYSLRQYAELTFSRKES
jgi:hypothetical protein